MAEATTATVDTASEAGEARIYEVGYHVIPTVGEDQLEKIVGTIRTVIEKAGGSFIAEGAPALMKLAYDMEAREGDKNVVHDRGYFGWIKFEAMPQTAQELADALKADPTILRHIVFRTVREDTRARFKAPTLREVRRTDTLKPAVRREEGAAAPVSEEDLDKALSDLTTE